MNNIQWNKDTTASDEAEANLDGNDNEADSDDINQKERYPLQTKNNDDALYYPV